jgi:uncharacterized protein
MQKVLVAGGSGLVGYELSCQLRGLGFQVIHLSRKANVNAEFPAYFWNVEKGLIDENAFKNVDYIVNLAGAGIADKRWTAQRKREIIESRTESTKLLSQYLNKSNHRIKAYISASAIGFYGNRENEILTEESSAGHNFLSESTIAWEKSVDDIVKTNTRTVIIRIGIVLSKKGGALQQMLIPFLFRLGVYFGNGKQWFSWIHIEDICRIFIWAIENEKAQGKYNGVSPNPLSNYDFTKAISTAKGGFNLMIPAPAFALRLAMGEMANMILGSTRVSSQKIESQGFKFKFTDAVEAIKDVLKRKI